jgi:adenosylhomocysteinase
MSIVKDVSLASAGLPKIKWAEAHMPVLSKIRKRLTAEKTFEGLTIGMCIHLEMKTAVLALTLKACGAEVAITGSNPLSTQDDVAAALAGSNVNVYAWHGVTPEDHKQNLGRVLAHKPDIIMDDGAELSVAIHKEYRNLFGKTLGACEETTTGVLRFRAMEKDGVLRFPVIAVNDAQTKYLFDSQYGTGQSALEGVMRATNLLIAGKSLVVAGYGWVGRGIAHRARGLGAKVTVTEVDPIRALEAVMEGFDVVPMLEAARQGDIFITATGCRDVITEKEIQVMKDGAILANSGHFDVEVSVRDLERLAKETRTVRTNVEEYSLPDGRKIYLLAKGRLVNLAAADGHAAEVMDMSFADQALAAEYLIKNKSSLRPAVYKMPIELDREVARLALEAWGKRTDQITNAQRRYIESWE